MTDNLARVTRPNWQPQSATPMIVDGATARKPRPVAPVIEGTAPERRHIEIVTSRSQRRARPRIVYALSALGALGTIIVAQLLLSVSISQGAYEVASLQDRQVELGRAAESVSEDLVRVASPQSLAINAESLGMVTNSNPVYLRLSDGAVLGAPASATAAGGNTNLVPNSLLAGAPLLGTAPAAGALETGVAAPEAPGAPVPSGVTPPQTAVTNGLPAPTTR